MPSPVGVKPGKSIYTPTGNTQNLSWHRTPKGNPAPWIIPDTSQCHIFEDDDTVSLDSDKPPDLASEVDSEPSIACNFRKIEREANVQKSNSREAAKKKFVTIELCGGCARLTLCLTQNGFGGACAVDWQRNNSVPEGNSILLDLTKPESVEYLKSVMRSVETPCKFVHAAPPCGTASKARSIPIPEYKLRQGAPAPVPLRSTEWPEGLPGLQGLDLVRVTLANSLYDAIAEIIIFADSLNILWCIENPRSSFYWLTRGVLRILATVKRRVFESIYQACMHGGSRPKWQRFLHIIESFCELELTCDGSHDHEPWGVHKVGQKWKFNTADEAAYAMLLCQRMASLVVKQLALDGFVMPADTKQCSVMAFSPLKKARLDPPPGPSPNVGAATAGRQARGQRSPVFLPEHRTTVTFAVTQETFEQYEENYKFPSDISFGTAEVKKGAKLLRKQQIKQGSVGLIFEFRFVVAVPWHPEEFLAAAKTKLHPIDCTNSLQPSFYLNLFNVLVRGPEWAESFRLGQLVKAKQWEKELRSEETILHSSLCSDAQEILKEKKILLFQRLCRESGVNDPRLIQRICSGFQITGKLDEAGFPPRPREASTDRASILKSSKWARAALLGSLRSSGDQEIDREVWDTSILETTCGQAHGPFSADELDKRHGNCWLACRRFGVKQGGKIRCCDDFSEFLVNASVTSPEKLVLGDTDEIFGMARAMLGAVSDNREVRVPSGPSGFHTGTLHASWTIDEARDLVGRTVDLKSAYKQLMRSRSDASVCVYAVFKPATESSPPSHAFFEEVALPFGATGSVYGFNRASWALRMILVGFFGLLISHFFDDFIHLEFRRLQKSGGFVCLELFRLVGWLISMGDKLLPFDSCFKSLGVQFSLFPDKVSARNTDTRVKNVSEEITDMRSRKTCTAPEAATLRGRFSFCETQHWGRCGSLFTQSLSVRAMQAGGSSFIGPGLDDDLECLQRLMLNSPARTMQARVVVWPNLIFSDAAADDSDVPGVQTVTYGAILFRRNCTPQYFAGTVDVDVVAHWQSLGSKQVISQGELFPIIVAKLTWAAELRGGRNVWLLDNDSAKEGLIRCFSPVWSNQELLRVGTACDLVSESFNWYARVASEANIADDVSRLEFGTMIKMEAVRVQPKLISLTNLRSTKLLSLLRGGVS